MRRGSALLVVLGMLSFMVVSAVAFSVFMRQGRLPSSFLRQRIQARQLVKAGLAEALAEIDQAIGNAKYPGHEYGNESNKNYWRNRVYMGVSGDGYEVDADHTHLRETVSTFPMEGLAYIPPPLVNTVRHWARRSPAAKWKNLAYDSGRYAFTAVNVSDYLDINRFRANVMRDSSPSNRISLAFLLEDASHTGWTVKPQDFDKALASIGKTGSGSGDAYRRLVSMADYNLALSPGGDLAGCGFESPFFQYIDNPPKDGSFYGSLEESAKGQKFVTDSWYPGPLKASASAGTAHYLTDADTQPLLSWTEAGLTPLMKNQTPGVNKIKNNLNLAERAALRDYLDEDNVPTSLALPTLERAPMLTGLQIRPQGFKPVIEEAEPQVEMQADGKKRVTHRFWKLSSLDNPQALVGASVVFPFKRSSGLAANASYELQVLVKAYLVDESASGLDRTRSEFPNFAFRPAAEGDWAANDLLSAPQQCCLQVFGSQTFSVTAGQDENNALQDVAFSAAGANMAARPLYGLAITEVKNDMGVWQQEGEPVYDTSRFSEVPGKAFYALSANGAPAEVGDGANLKWQFYAWARIKTGNTTVDCVPATFQDDNAYNGLQLPPVSLDLLGQPLKEPLIPMVGSHALTLALAQFQGGGGGAAGDGTGAALAIYCNDPRYNWAPENWLSAGEGASVSAQDWLTKAKSFLGNGADYRQQDIFQFISNQDYMQSMGEIQFLPLVRKDPTDFSLDKAGGSGTLSGSFFTSTSRYNGDPFKTGAFGQEADHDYAWKTYWVMGEWAAHEDGEDYCPFEWGVEDTNGGAAVSPYADKDLLMAALANTPYDYIVASEKDDNDLESNIDLCFNARSSEAKLSWDDLEKIADRIRQKFAESNVETGADKDVDDVTVHMEDWEGWTKGTGADIFEGISGIHDVDRKFLFSYWRPCFANRQQLFLVFVRAEPTVVAGDNAGHTPAQLGARAVALVWREPVSTLTANGTSYPSHRMRILFYHQFE